MLERRRGDEAVFDFFYLDALHGLIFGMTCGVSKLFSLIGPRAHEVSRPGVNKSASDFLFFSTKESYSNCMMDGR